MSMTENEEAVARSLKNQPHPRGQRILGSCQYLECTEEATESRRVIRGSGLSMRVMVDICTTHAQQLDGGAPILLEFVKG